MNLRDLDTPCGRVDAKIAENDIAKKRRGLGAKGIRCQRIGKAEIMADAGIVDALANHDILGSAELSRSKAAHDWGAIGFCTKNEVIPHGYTQAFLDSSHHHAQRT